VAVRLRPAKPRPLPARVGVPAYFYPWPHDRFWAALVDAPDGTIVILDPDNGPGPAPDPNYEAAVGALRTGRATLYGYVDSDYGARSLASMLDDAASHRSWYGVDGIFVDQVVATAARREHYAELCAGLRAGGFAVALNPGQPVIDPTYADLADQLVVFEGTLAGYRACLFPEWMSRARRDQLWHLVYEVADAEDFRTVARLAAQRNAGVLHATDGTMPNPWDRLPPYWMASSTG
jgi:hypothetical protein